MKHVAERLAEGQRVTFRPTGNSMQPLIHSKDEVVVAPLAEGAVLEVGDIVLVRVSGSIYLHLVDAVDRPRERVRIANNRGRINGWAPLRQVYGVCVQVAGVARPRASAKAAEAT